MLDNMIRFIFSLFALVFILWVYDDVQSGFSIPVNRNAKDVVTWENDPVLFSFTVGVRAISALILVWYALFHDFKKPRKTKKVRTNRRKERLKRKYLNGSK